MWNEPDVGEHIEDVISSFYINVLGFPKDTSTPREQQMYLDVSYI